MRKINNILRSMRDFFTDNSLSWKSGWAGKVVTISAFLFIAMSILRHILGSYLSGSTYTLALIIWAIGSLRDVSLWIMLATMVIFGIRDVRKNGHDIKRFLNPVLGVSVLLLGIFVFSFYYMKRDSFIDNLQMKVPDGVAARLDSMMKKEDVTMEVKARASRLYAKMKYEEDGSMIYHLLPDGKSVVFNPTAEEKEFRRELLKTRAMWEDLDNAMSRAIVIWPMVLIFSLLLGFLTPVKKVAVVQQERGGERT